MKKIVFLLLAIIFIPRINFACSCIIPSSFCESITSSTGEVIPQFILRGKITGGTPGELEIRVDQLIYGLLDDEKIKIRNQFCTLYFNELENNQEYIFALSHFEDEYNLLSCAVSFLKIENETIVGNIAPGIQSINYTEIFELEACGEAFSQINLKNNVSLFPNPTNGVFYLQVNQRKISFEDYELSLFDILGRKLSNHLQLEGILEENYWAINIQDIPSGAYIIRLSNSFQECAFRVVKE